ncbi:Peptidase S10, serine carboxypeptidase, partial [Dillenia turbinata]
MKIIEELTWVTFFCMVFSSNHCYGQRGFHPLNNLLSKRYSKEQELEETLNYYRKPQILGTQKGLKESGKIKSLPGEPDGVDFDQYSGRALFYYFVESPNNSSSKPLVLWLNGGPGCSSLGNGALIELGPFRVNKDGRTLHKNQYAWNIEYELNGDNRTAQNRYTFFYKTRDRFVTGESYAGISRRSWHKESFTITSTRTKPKLILEELHSKHMLSYPMNYMQKLQANAISHLQMPQLKLVSTFYSECARLWAALTPLTSMPRCRPTSSSMNLLLIGNAYIDYKTTTGSISALDSRSKNYISSYLNIPKVQEAIHANVSSLPYNWEVCSDSTAKYSDANGEWIAHLDLQYQQVALVEITFTLKNIEEKGLHTKFNNPTLSAMVSASASGKSLQPYFVQNVKTASCGSSNMLAVPAPTTPTVTFGVPAALRSTMWEILTSWRHQKFTTALQRQPSSVLHE